MARWYDKHEKLGKYLDGLKGKDEKARDGLITGIMLLIKENDPHLLDDLVMGFPLSLHRRRWYDNDPYLWLIFNGLEYAEEKLLNKIASFLEIEASKLEGL